MGKGPKKDSQPADGFSIQDIFREENTSAGVKPKTSQQGYLKTVDHSPLQDDFDKDLNGSGSFSTGKTTVEGADVVRVNTQASDQGASGNHEVVVTWYNSDGQERLTKTYTADTSHSLNLYVKQAQVDVTVNDTTGSTNYIQGTVTTK